MKFSKNVNKYGRDIRGEESRHAIGPHQRCDLLLQTVKFEYSKLFHLLRWCRGLWAVNILCREVVVCVLNFQRSVLVGPEIRSHYQKVR